ncbi:hypothetical protein HWV62_44147 [Athelia sp. TMB]|nr:hypothetical protein HWV62_44147 [Athelia sp. TMB]
MSREQRPWLDVWCSFPPSMKADDDIGDLAWLRSLFSMLSRHVLSFPDLSDTLQKTENRIKYPDETHFPPEVQIYKMLTLLCREKRLPPQRHYACLCKFMMDSNCSRDSGARDGSNLFVELFADVAQSHSSTTLSGAAEESDAVQEVLRFLTRRAYFTADVRARYLTGSIIDPTQRKKFLESVHELLAKSRDAQTPLSPLNHFYVFDLVREYNSRPEDPTPLNNAAQGAEPIQNWANRMRQTYHEYVEGASDLGDLKEHFYRLGNEFPYAAPASPNAETTDSHIPENAEA